MFLVAFAGHAVHAAAPDGGSTITNQATATFVDSAGQSQTLRSNTVQTTVAQVASFTLVSGQSSTAAPGQTVNFPHTLTNTGNGTDTFDLSGTDTFAGSFNFTSVTLYADANCDGVPDNSTAITGTGALARNGQFCFVAAAAIPGGVAPATSDQMTVTGQGNAAAAASGGYTAATAQTNTDVVTVIAAPGGLDLTLTKTHSGNFTVGRPGTYALRVRNIGGTATSGPITVTDTLPVGLAFVPAGSGGVSWSCSAVRQIVTCASSAVIPAASSHPNALTIVVNPSAPALSASPVTNTATVSGGGEPLASRGNNSASDPTLIDDTARLSGRVWRDLNHDRRYAVGETLLKSFIVDFMDASNKVLRSARTNGRGAYSFKDVTPGAGYRLRFRDPATGHPVRGMPVDGEQGTPVSGATVTNGIIEDLTLGPGDTITQQSLPLDPSGVVYDAITRRPVAGAVVTLRGPASFNPSTQLLGGRGNLAQTTGATGQYQYLLLAGAPSGTYTLAVTAPPRYRPFPSTLIPPAASAGGCPQANCLDPTGLAGPGLAYPIVSLGSAPPAGAPTTYFLRFRLNLASDPSIVNNHLPLDPTSFDGSGLLVQKSVTRNIVEIGEFVDYTVQIRNSTSFAIPRLSVTDRLPAGFAYLKGSARLDGAPVPDPAGGAGPLLRFTGLGTLTPNATRSLRYRVRIGPSAQLGDGINHAQATGGAFRSNVASVRVQVVGGVFSDRGFILGKLYTDCNRSRVQEPGEVGIPSVRLYLENGTYVVTDSEGKFSFYGLEALTHVLKVDASTLPRGSKLITLSNRHAGNPNSLFVDLKKGELHRADFAEASCSNEVMQEVKRRRALTEVVVPETDRGLDYDLTPDGLPIPLSDPKSLPASGVVGQDAAQPIPQHRGAAAIAGAPSPQGQQRYQPLLGPDTLSSKNSNLPPAPVAAVPQVDLERLLPGLDNNLGFVDLQDGDTLPIAQTHVRVKGQAGSSFKLSVNGTEISEARVGRKAVLAEQRLLAWEYIGIPLKAGRNTLTVLQIDPFGNERGMRTIHLIAPDRLGRIEIHLPETPIADGHTAVPVTVRLTDAKGVPITVRTPLTLEATAVRWQVEDLDKIEPGVQVFIDGGKAEYRLLPPHEPREDLIRVSSGVLQAERRLTFLPELRPLIAAGVVEGTLALRSFDLGKLVAARERDGFEEELETFAVEGNDGRVKAAGRSALFLKGKVKGDYLLTLAYDSDKDPRERLFRDIQPDEFYPVYGDSSFRGFDAQSTSHLYVRVDKGPSHLLYGDFLAQEPSEVRSLSAYHRSLTGLKGNFENDWLNVDLFAANDNTRRVIENIPANGTSGPFLLKNGNIVEHSEQVEILTHDRNQPAVVLEIEPQARFSDYTLDPFTGQLLFKAPIPSLDERLNRRSIRITYEVDQGGDSFWTYGMDAQFKLTERLELGGVYVRDENPLDEYELKGANATLRLTEKTFLFGEYAITDAQGPVSFTPLPGLTSGLASGSGDAWRAEIRHEDGRLGARAFYGQAENSFNNPNAYLTNGRREAGAKATYALTPQDSLTGEALRTEDRFFGGKRQGVELSYGHAFENNVRAEVGMRHSDESLRPAQPTSIGTTPNEVTSLRGKLTVPVPYFPEASLFGEYEQDLFDSDKRVAALGGDYQFSTRGRLYARHELISSLSSPYALNQLQENHSTVVGIDTEYLKDANLFTEYRASDAFDGRSTQAAIGTRNAWHLFEGLTLNTSTEQVKTLESAGTGFDSDSQAYTAALEYTGHPLWKASGRVEYYHASNAESWLNTLGLARKLDRDWTFLGRSILALTDSEGAAGQSLQHRLQLGVAYRDTTTNVWNALARYEHKYEDGSPRVGFGLNTIDPGLDLKRTVDAVSLHYSYQPERSWVLSGRIAAKYVQEDSFGIKSNYDAELFMGRYTMDLTERWDIGLQASALAGEGFKSVQFGFGPELGYRVTDNLWASAGYNLFGFEDEDLSADEHTDQGVYVRLRFKFDEELFKPVMDLLK